jgi:hypothetical protein
VHKYPSWYILLCSCRNRSWVKSPNYVDSDFIFIKSNFWIRFSWLSYIQAIFNVVIFWWLRFRWNKGVKTVNHCGVTAARPPGWDLWALVDRSCRACAAIGVLASSAAPRRRTAGCGARPGWIPAIREVINQDQTGNFRWYLRVITHKNTLF